MNSQFKDDRQRGGASRTAPVGVAGPGITLIARCLRRSGVDAVPATGAGERVDERPVGRGRSPTTFAAHHLGSIVGVPTPRA